MKYRQKAISWLLHSLKIILGDESIRRYIILHYNQSITNSSKKYIKTFDAFLEKGKTREQKAEKIIGYCEEICQKKCIVVFTATNIQIDKFDNETHFQSYIVDNNKQKLIIVDPAYDNKKENNAGIYMAEVSNEVIAPFFKSKGYKIQFIELTTPAQISEGDVFCQSWSLYILLQKLKNKEYNKNISFDIPEDQLDKYDMLLEFYKQIFTDMPELGENLQTEYEAEILESRGPNSPTKTEREAFLEMNPVDLLLEMTKYEMK
jgi:hypothetical protein